MTFAPKHNWNMYDAAVSRHEIAMLQAQTPVEKPQRYAHLFDMLHALRPYRTWDDPVQIQHWKEKRETRMRYVNALCERAHEAKGRTERITGNGKIDSANG